MIEKPKKERRFLKILGKVGEILVQELLIKVGKSLVQKIGGKKTLPSIIFLSLFYNIAYASIDSIPYPITGNKQRLGWQTTGNGLVYRGRSNDTITKPTNYVDKNVKAYLILDSVRGTIFVWRQTYWDSLLVGGGGLTMPFDSISFNTAKDGTVGVGEVEYNDTQGSLIQGLKGGNVTNVIGQQLHQRVNNRTGAPLAKGDVVYLSGSQGNRITVAKALATSDPTSANTFGIVAESIADNASGYVITEGLITGLNTSALTQDSAVYLSGTTAGALTSTKPQAPIHGVYIGVCVKSNAGSGEVFVKIRNGSELDELHDVQITSPANNASLYYKSSEGLWRDTTAALLVSDTASMLTNYLRTGIAASTYLTQSNAASTYLPLTGGTLTGGLNGTTGAFTSNLTIGNILSNEVKSISAYGLNNGTLVTSSGGSLLILYNLSGNINTFSTLSFYNKTSNGTIYPAAQIRGIKSSDQTSVLSGSLSFDLVDTTGNYQERLRLTNIGNFGIGTNTPSYKLDVNGTFNASGNSLIGGTLSVTSNITGNSFIKSGGTSSQFLKADGTIDGTSYLPLTGGTLTGGLTGTTALFSGNVAIGFPFAYKPFEVLSNANDFVSVGVRELAKFQYSGIHFGYRQENVNYRKSAIVFQRNEGYTLDASGRLHILNVNEGEGSRSADLRDAKITISNNGGVGINDTTPLFTLDVNGTLGVTGATTLSAPLTVNSSAVFNEGSADADFRVESDGNANMVFVDASTDRVGIGTNAPTKTLDVNGEVKIATTTATPTSLLGKDGSNVVGEVTTVAQTGLMKAGGTTANTSSVGIITVAHGLSYTPSQVIATVAQQNSYVIVCHSKDGTNMSFTVYDSVTGNALNNVSVGFFWLAIK